MARWSPTVLPQPLDLGSVLDRIAQGYALGMSLSDQRRRRELEQRQLQEHEEDRKRMLDQLRAEDLAKPGASTLADYLERYLERAANKPTRFSPAAQPTFRGTPLATLTGSPQAEARFREEAEASSPLLPSALRRVASAEDTGVTIDFKRPPPVTVTLPGGRTAQFQDRAPYLTPSGIVIDPQRAREEATLAKALEAYESRLAQLPTPEEIEADVRRARLIARAEAEGRRPTPQEREEDIDYQRRLAQATGLYEQRTRPPTTVQRIPISVQALDRQIEDTRRLLQTLNSTAYRPADPTDTLAAKVYEQNLRQIHELSEQLKELMKRRNDLTLQLLRGQSEGTESGGTGPAGLLSDKELGITQEQLDSARVGGKVPVDQGTYNDLVRQFGKEFAAENYVITPSKGVLLNKAQADSLRTGGPAPISQPEYDLMVQLYGEGFARRHFYVPR